MTPWTASQIPDQTERIALITGANSGIGLQAALELARHNAHVVMGCRSEDKANQARDSILKEVPNASLEILLMDLADLSSIKKAAEIFLEKHNSLDLLINNAGVMALPYRKTADGFEMQLGTNHLGHFALTGHLLPAILKTKDARIVHVSSNAHKMGNMNFKDLQSEKKYNKWVAYGQSKLANLLFAYELQRKLEASKASAISVACHPGYSATNLFFPGPRMQGSALMEKLSSLGNKLVAQPPSMGALPTLYAATAPGVRGGEYFGPGGAIEMKGYPRKVQSNKRSHNLQDAQQLWEASQKLTDVSYASLSS